MHRRRRRRRADSHSNDAERGANWQLDKDTHTVSFMCALTPTDDAPIKQERTRGAFAPGSTSCADVVDCAGLADIE